MLEIISLHITIHPQVDEQIPDVGSVMKSQEKYTHDGSWNPMKSS